MWTRLIIPIINEKSLLVNIAIIFNILSSPLFNNSPFVHIQHFVNKIICI